jgi:secreted trypsin-like serine protease
VATILAVVMQTVILASGHVSAGQAQAWKDAANGVDVADGQYPFVAGIGYADSSGEFLWENLFCGGSLVAPNVVLTAAHCVVGATPDQLAVVVGRTVMSSSEGQVRDVIEIISDPAYDPSNAAHDLAVLRLDQPVLGITPIELVEAGDTALSKPGTPLILVGWGDERPPHGGESALRPDWLQQELVIVVPDRTCARRWGRTGYVDDAVWPIFVCSTPGTFGQGDSGGPLFAATPDGYVQVTLVSGGYAHLHKGRVQKFIPDYGPELSAQSSANFLASVLGGYEENR